jgi:hypothetical protein
VKVDIKPADSVLRVFDDNSNYGDKYLWACSVKKIDKIVKSSAIRTGVGPFGFGELQSTYELMGVTVPPTIEIWRALRQYSKQERITIILRRIKNGKERVKIIKP